jgi:ABC-2 type transport system permease protein
VRPVALRRAAPRGTQRPEILGADPRRFWHLTWTLAETDFKLRFYGSALGVMWSLARPFAFFGVLYVVFVEIVHLGDDIPNYAAYILLTMTLFNFFAETVGNCVGCLITRENLLRKMRFPRLVIPLSVALTALMNLGMALVAVAIFLIAIMGLDPAWSWLQIVPVVLLLTIFALGLGLLLGSMFVRYRDVQPIWEVALQMLFYASPIIYTATTVPEEWQKLYLCNPIAAVLTQMRHAMLDPDAPSTATLMGGTAWLLIPLGIVLASFALGVWAFIREAPKVAENL